MLIVWQGRDLWVTRIAPTVMEARDSRPRVRDSGTAPPGRRKTDQKEARASEIPFP